MPDYWYESITPVGEVRRGWISALNEREVEDRVRAQGEYLVRSEARERPADVRTDGRIDRKDMLAFTEYLSGSLQVGIPLLSSLADVEGRLTSKRMRQIVGEIRESIEVRGKSFSEALAEHPKAFTQLYIGTVEAGEASGQLDYALRQLVSYLDWQAEISTQIRQATAYPIVVVLGIFAVLGLLVGFVYPRLQPVFERFDVELPLPTRMVMGFSTFVRDHWFLMFLIVAGLITAVIMLARSQRGRLFLDAVLLKLPVFGSLVYQINMARVVTYLALFYRTGIEIIRGLLLVEQMIPNRIVAGHVRAVREAIVSGETMAEAFGRSGFFSPMVVRSIALGETTGSLDEALGRARIYYEREVPALVKRMVTALQPLLVILLGAVIATVALSIFLPILKIYQSIGVRR